MMMLSRISFVCAALVAIVAVACDTMPLTAPSGSALTISAGSTFVPTGGTTEITAFVVESSGTAVQNGTTVHFSTNLGRVDPVDALTTNGYAVTTFMAGDSSGVADVTATSGGTGADDSSEHRQWEWRDDYAVHDKQQRCANHRRRRGGGDVVLAANPGSVPSGGGTVDLDRDCLGPNGRSLRDCPLRLRRQRVHSRVPRR